MCRVALWRAPAVCSLPCLWCCPARSSSSTLACRLPTGIRLTTVRRRLWIRPCACSQASASMTLTWLRHLHDLELPTALPACTGSGRRAVWSLVRVWAAAVRVLRHCDSRCSLVHRLHAHATATGGVARGDDVPCLAYVVEWSALLRVDLLALALSTWALFVVSRWPLDRRAPVLAAVLLVGAVFTRQSYGLAAPLAAFVWLWARGDGAGRCSSLLLRLPWAGLAASAGANDRWWVPGPTSSLPMSTPSTSIALATVPTRSRGSPPLCWRGSPSTAARASRTLRVAAGRPYLVGSLVSAATIGKVGSNVNYLLEFCTAISLAGSVLVGWLGRRPVGRHRRRRNSGGGPWGRGTCGHRAADGVPRAHITGRSSPAQGTPGDGAGGCQPGGDRPGVRRSGPRRRIWDC